MISHILSQTDDSMDDFHQFAMMKWKETHPHTLSVDNEISGIHSKKTKPKTQSCVQQNKIKKSKQT